jgi:anti-anti-sigma regulatory factor
MRMFTNPLEIRHHRLIFMCWRDYGKFGEYRLDPSERTFYLTLADIRDWKGLRKFISRGGHVWASHPRGKRRRQFWLWNRRDDSYTEIKTEAQMKAAYEQVDRAAALSYIVARVSEKEQECQRADLLQMYPSWTREQINIHLRQTRWFVVKGQKWEWIYPPQPVGWIYGVSDGCQEAPRETRDGPSLEVGEIADVAMVLFMDRKMDEQKIEAIGDQLFSLVDGGRKQLLLDFRHVEHPSNTLLNKLVALNQRVKAVGGSLSLLHLDHVVIVSAGLDKGFFLRCGGNLDATVHASSP